MRYRKKPLEIEAWRYGEEATPGVGARRVRERRSAPDPGRRGEGAHARREHDGAQGRLHREGHQGGAVPREARHLRGDLRERRCAEGLARRRHGGERPPNDVIGLEAAGDMEVPEYPFARILCAADELGSVEDWMSTETDDE